MTSELLTYVQLINAVSVAILFLHSRAQWPLSPHRRQLVRDLISCTLSFFRNIGRFGLMAAPWSCWMRRFVYPRSFTAAFFRSLLARHVQLGTLLLHKEILCQVFWKIVLFEFLKEDVDILTSHPAILSIVAHVDEDVCALRVPFQE